MGRLGRAVQSESLGQRFELVGGKPRPNGPSSQQRVETGHGRSGQAGGLRGLFQEMEIEGTVVSHKRKVTAKGEELRQSLSRIAPFGHLGGGDAGQGGEKGRDRTSRANHTRKGLFDLSLAYAHGADLDDFLALKVEAGGLQVEGHEVLAGMKWHLPKVASLVQ